MRPFGPEVPGSTRGEELAIGAESDGFHATINWERADQLSRLRIPESNGAVVRGGCESAAIRTEGHRVYLVRVSGERLEQGRRSGRPKR